MSNSSRIITKTLHGLWGCLGAYRGHQFYNKDNNYNMEYKNKHGNGKYTEPKYYLTDNIGVSLLSTFFYICPPLSLAAFYYELCTFEDFIRNRNNK